MQPSTAAAIPLARADPDHLELRQLILIDLANREGRVILQTVWCVDRRGRRETEIEVIPNEAALLRRVGELAPRLFGARAEEVLLKRA
jgi:hypothetical protein